MRNAFIRSGHGYESGSRGRCTCFDGFEIIAAPLGEFDNTARESRIFRRNADGNGGVDYSSHALKLARMEGERSGNLYILMHNGSGREVLKLHKFYDGGDLAEHITALPERLQYALLYSIWATADNARYEAQWSTANEWAQAFASGRIRKRRATNSRPARVEIVPEWQAAGGRANG